MKMMKALACVTSMGALMAGCSTPPTAPVAPTPAPVAPPAVVAEPAKPVPVAAAAVPEYLDPNSPISKERSVYFDFNVYTVKTEYTAMLDRQGKYLAAHPDVSIKVEGNTDERGGTEYNLALGQKRAEAVVRALKVYGVKDAQMEAVSFGEEKPKDTAHTDAAWSENRRADLAYPSK